MRGALLLLLVLGCGAAADEGDDVPVEAEPAATQEAEPERRATPLCEGEDAPVAGECQKLVYGDRGYCNRWVDCASL
jgi:hypothetical protein